MGGMGSLHVTETRARCEYNRNFHSKQVEYLSNTNDFSVQHHQSTSAGREGTCHSLTERIYIFDNAQIGFNAMNALERETAMPAVNAR